MSSYTVTAVDDDPMIRDSDGRGVVTFDVTFDDGTTKTKRMHADLSSKESMKADIEQWLADFTNPDAPTLPETATKLVGTTGEI